VDAAARARHLDALRALTAPGGSIDPEAPTATHQRPENYVDGTWTMRRQKLHKQILDEYFAENPHVARDNRAIIMSGPPGAGKSSALKEKVPDEEKHLWRTIDADEFKKRLVSKLRQTGEFEAIIPPDVQARIDAGETFTPGEFASLVHEESSWLAARAARRSLQRGERVVLDGVNGSKGKLISRLEGLQASGYVHAEIIAVDGPRDVTRARVEHRWYEAYAKYVDEGDEDAGYDARYVPEEVTNVLYVETDRFSACSRAVGDLVKDGPVQGLVVNAQMYYVDEPAGKPQLWRTFQQDGDRFIVTKHRRIDNPSSSGAAAPLTTEQPGSSSDRQAADNPAAAGEIVVPGYVRKDGTVVRSHTKKRPTRRQG
jgi:chloramphenicol 3-O-phosphotransferase